MAEHTPLPWQYRPNKYDDWGYIRGPKDDDGPGPIAAIARGESDLSRDEHRAAGTDPYAANAALIIKAVNNHAALVVALQLAEAVLNEIALYQGRPLAVLEPVRKALSEVGASYLAPVSGVKEVES